MTKIMKRTVDALQPEPERDVFAWDTEVRGFGVRVKRSGVKTFLIQYRNAEGRTRRLVLGQYGALTPDAARDLARKKLTAVRGRGRRPIGRPPRSPRRYDRQRGLRLVSRTG
jgi:hypothetical protein